MYEVISSEGESITFDNLDGDNVITRMKEMSLNEKLEIPLSTDTLLMFKHFTIFEKLDEKFVDVLNEAIFLMDKDFLSFLKRLFFALDYEKQKEIVDKVHDDVLYELFHEKDMLTITNPDHYYLWFKYNISYVNFNFDVKIIRKDDLETFKPLRYFEDLAKKVVKIRDVFEFLLEEDNLHILQKLYKVRLEYNMCYLEDRDDSVLIYTSYRIYFDTGIYGRNKKITKIRLEPDSYTSLVIEYNQNIDVKIYSLSGRGSQLYDKFTIEDGKLVYEEWKSYLNVGIVI